MDVKATIVRALIDCGWTACVNETAIASKSFQTAVGEKTAHAYLSNGDQFNRTLLGSYYSEGRNILKSVLIPNDAGIECCVALAAEFASGVESVVSDSYAVKLFRPK